MDRVLQTRLSAIRQQGLYRTLRRVEGVAGTRVRVDGRELLNFSSNDYLGLASDGCLGEAVSGAVSRLGVGSAASRLICGSLAVHHELEEALADFKGTQAALLFPSGYAAALGAITSLVGREDVVVIDKLVHASLVDGTRLSGAKLRVYPHNRVDQLERVLRWAAERKAGRRADSRVLIVTESVFSMDGDQAPLREIVRLKEQYGAWLMVDEAHATGLFGPRREGLVNAFGIGDQVEIQLGTLGKALGAVGGYVCGSRVLVDYLVNRARTFIFTTAPSPIVSAAARFAVGLLSGDEGARRCARLWDRVREVGRGGENDPDGLAIPSAGTSAILPLMVGDESRAMRIAENLMHRGMFIPAVRYPTVPRGKARLRLTLSAAHTEADIRSLRVTLRKTLDESDALAALPEDSSST